jgi:predicted PurR-regulated permease PerM
VDESDFRSDEIESPRWNATVKLIFGLTFVALTLGLLFYFRGYIGPLILAILVTYLFHPIAHWMTRTTRLPWRLNVGIIYLAVLVSLIGLSTWTGVVIVQQVESLYGVVVNFINDLPNILQQLSSQRYFIGPFEVDFGRYLALDTLAQQFIQMIQPLLGQTTSLVGGLATRAATTIGLALFILLISYFLLSEAGSLPNVIGAQIPGYDADIRRLGRELSRIWNAFFRGQLLIMFLVTIAYILVTSILGVRYAIGISILAGAARFIPYVGGFLTWLVIVLAAFFQPTNYFGFEPLVYTILVMICAIIVDQIFDNVVSPQIMGQSLRVHPAAVLVGALIAASLMGFIGVLLAAPVVASLKLFGSYAFCKMFDLNPWDELTETPLRPPQPVWFIRLYQWYYLQWQTRQKNRKR